MTAIFISAGLVDVQIHCTDPSLADQLRTRYDGFLMDENEPAFKIDIHLDDTIPPEMHLSPACTFEGLQIFFDLPGYSGSIDPARGASLRLSSLTPVTSVDYFLRVVFSALAFRNGGLLLHAAGIIRNGRAFLFFGRSGSGKTTVARNSSEDTVINDDLVILQPKATTWHAHGTPFTNPTQVNPSAASAPAVGLFKLVQSPHVFAEPLAGARAIAELMTSVPVLNGSPEPPLDRCQEILRSVPAFELHLRDDESFWPVIENL